MKFRQFLKEEEKLELSLSEGQINPLFKGNSAIMSLDKAIIQGRGDKSQVMDNLNKLYMEYLPKLETVQKKLDVLMRGVYKGYKNVKYKSAIKPFNSVVDKALNRKKGFSQLNDLVRCAVLFESSEAADDFIKTFTRKYKSLIVGYESKEKGADQTYGYYGSHHLDIEIDGIICEVQVMSKKMWNYKKAAHAIYTANRSKDGGPSKEDMYLSKKIFSMANAPGYVREEFEEFKDIELLERDIIDLSDFGDEF